LAAGLPIKALKSFNDFIKNTLSLSGCQILYCNQYGNMRSTPKKQGYAIMGFMGIGMQELFLILLIVLILFGAKKVPELARGLGSGIREFKKAAKEVGDGGDSAKAASASDPAAGQAGSALSSSGNPQQSDAEHR
jgi:sec-independent protein translocase protein TatA